MTDTEKDPWREGGNAYRRGQPISTNPYPKDAEEWKSWCLGWSDMDEHFTDRELYLGI